MTSKKDRARIDYMPGSAAVDALGIAWCHVSRYAPTSPARQAGDNGALCAALARAKTLWD